MDRSDERLIIVVPGPEEGSLTLSLKVLGGLNAHAGLLQTRAHGTVRCEFGSVVTKY